MGFWLFPLSGLLTVRVESIAIDDIKLGPFINLLGLAG